MSHFKVSTGISLLERISEKDVLDKSWRIQRDTLDGDLDLQISNFKEVI